ncbi:MAG: pyridoxal phosphate-dependent aminotransferase, partial [Clostridia bacterium]|nr:pyridoxal phosphate-dependent aminotransferase [Clostridia bacterium]
MVSQKMYELGSKRSEIRELFEYGLKRKAEIGAENVFDFSLGNPSVPAPDCVKQALSDLISNTDPVALHGYTSAQGAQEVRGACAEYANKTHGTSYTGDNFYMTVG